jgi:hypothetical protein
MFFIKSDIMKYISNDKEIVRDYFMDGYKKIEDNGYDGIVFGTDKRTAKRLLVKKSQVHEAQYILGYSAIELSECSVATSLTFFQEQIFVSAKVFLMCEQFPMNEDIDSLAKELDSVIKNDHGSAWEKKSDIGSSDGYYISWNRENSYLGFAYTPGRKYKEYFTPFDLFVYWTKGTTDEAYRNEMKSQYGF